MTIDDRRGKLRTEFDDILSDDTMTHMEKVEEAIESAIALDANSGGEPSGEQLTALEREDATAARAVWDTLTERDRDFWRDRVRAGPHNPQAVG